MDVDSTFWSGFLGPSLGIGACMVANTAMGTSGVASHEAGLVSGLLNASRQCGGSVGLAVRSGVRRALRTAQAPKLIESAVPSVPRTR